LAAQPLHLPHSRRDHYGTKEKSMKSITDPVARFTTPERMSDTAPSFTSPDTRYAPGLRMARGLGWFSIGLGLAELVAPNAMAELTGVRNPSLLQAYGLREIATGIGILSSDRPAGWLWARVAGDAMDLATLAGAEDGSRAAGAALAVAGVTALDVMCAQALSAGAALEGSR